MINWITETISRIRVSIQPIELAYPSLNTLKPDSYMYWNKDTLDVPGPCSINGSLNIFQLSAVSVMKQKNMTLDREGSVILKKRWNVEQS